MAMANQATRLEHDLLGDKAVPADAYYGVQTARALENFHISGVRAAPVSRFHQGAGDGEAGRRARQLRLRPVRRDDPRRHRRRVPGNHRRQAPRPVPARRVPGRRRHVDQHERQRGHRQPRARADGPREGRVPATATRTTTSTRSQSTNDAYPTALHVGMALGNIRLVAAMQGADRGVPREGPASSPRS